MPSLHHPGRFVISLLALLFIVSADAAVIYRWIDKQGKTHFSDVVPEEYKGVAELVEAGDDASATRTTAACDRACGAAEGPRRRIAVDRLAAGPQPGAGGRNAGSVEAAIACADRRYGLRDLAQSLQREPGMLRPLSDGSRNQGRGFEHCTPVLEPPIRCQRNAP